MWYLPFVNAFSTLLESSEHEINGADSVWQQVEDCNSNQTTVEAVALVK